MLSVSWWWRGEELGPGSGPRGYQVVLPVCAKPLCAEAKGPRPPSPETRRGLETAEEWEWTVHMREAVRGTRGTLP